MIKRLKTSLGMVAGLAALSLGGAAIAGAATGTAHPAVKHAKHATREATQTRDTDQVQSGDQTTPDTSGASATSSVSETSGETGAASDGPGGHADAPGNVNTQNGDQSTPDTSGAPSEKSSPESGAASDGPGGPNLQQQGEH